MKTAIIEIANGFLVLLFQVVECFKRKEDHIDNFLFLWKIIIQKAKGCSKEIKWLERENISPQ